MLASKQTTKQTNKQSGLGKPPRLLAQPAGIRIQRLSGLLSVRDPAASVRKSGAERQVNTEWPLPRDNTPLALICGDFFAGRRQRGRRLPSPPLPLVPSPSSLFSPAATVRGDAVYLVGAGHYSATIRKVCSASSGQQDQFGRGR